MKLIAHVYQYWMVFLCGIVVAIAVERLVHSARQLQLDEDRIPVPFKELADVVLALGSLLGLLALRYLVSGILGSSDGMLVHYSRRQNIIQAWSGISRQQSRAFAVLWLAIYNKDVHMTWES